ncbi:MAG: rhomboid family intramembrane serine protease [Spirochaetaceae bacterium]|jgi:membrane associated rhomboid family serine protease|nr:rhomboid family intramembrane serine protease [Spirochaetaceae bacterium]
MKLKYNAPAVLSFTIISILVLLLSQTLMRGLIPKWFMVRGRGSFDFGSLRCWVTLVTHVIGHGDWNHLFSNFSFILLLGPILEANYGSPSLVIMMFLTALVTGLLNVLLFSSGLLGASGIVFMMILLASFTNFSRGEIPLTFILVLFIYLGRELFNSFSRDNISEFAHIAGGFCGSLFGFFRPGRK